MHEIKNQTFFRFSLDNEQIFWYIIDKICEQTFVTLEDTNMKNRKKLKRRTRIANKSRFMLFFSVCVLIITLSISSLTSAQSAKPTYQLCVASGDTLWEIARSSNTKNKDLRKVVDDIMKLNNMRSTNIKSGDIIQIPIY